ncbi:PREDICTED: exostosin-like 2 [Priapulus caudatus]|uniref:Exostosin-like 2 n=1 Tax=Priapulus caudatus TaxID=37621 RepID=A0ABM1F0M5_PRICU|nr:PREDICTED: exostosin-like 2 [Priapulus caudatus]
MRGRRLRVIYCVVALLCCVAYLLRYSSIVGVAPCGDRTHLTGYRDRRVTHAKPGNRTVDSSPLRTRPAAVPRFTVVMMTYRRNDLLRMVLTNYSKMAFIYRIILLWHNLGEEVPDFPYDIVKGAGKELIVIRPERNLLSNRMRLSADLMTEAVLISDDDTLISEADLLRAYTLWRWFNCRRR